MRPRRVALLALALGLSSREAVARTRRDVTVSSSLVIAVPSAYRASLDAFGRDGPELGFHLDGRGTLTSTRWWRFGARGGWTTFSVDARPYAPPNLIAQGAMGIHLFDLGGFARLVINDEREDHRFRVHLDFEAGAVLGGVTLGGVRQGFFAPRLGLSLCMGSRFSRVLLGVRAGFQYVPWSGAGGSAFDPVFSGFLVGFEGGWSQW